MALTVARQRRQEVLDGEGPEQADLDQADLLAARHHPLDRLVRDLGARAHHDDDALGLAGGRRSRRGGSAGRSARRTCPSPPGTMSGAAIVEAVAGLARLEERVRVLRRAAEHRLVRVQRALAVRLDERRVHHGAQIVVGQLLDLGHLVRRAEPVEEVQDRHARLAASPPGRCSAMSCASCTEPDASSAKPVCRHAMTSE